MPRGKDEASTGTGDVPYTLSGLHETCGRARRVYAPPPRGLLPIGWVADLMCHSVVGLFEAHRSQQLLHAERVGFVLLQQQPYFVQIVLGAVGGAGTCYTCIEKP